MVAHPFQRRALLPPERSETLLTLTVIGAVIIALLTWVFTVSVPFLWSAAWQKAAPTATTSSAASRREGLEQPDCACGPKRKGYGVSNRDAR
jgi:hypothetical protein